MLKMKTNSVLKSVSMLVLVVSIILSLIIEVSASEKLVVMTWGGHWGESFRETLAKPFEKQFGITVEVEIQHSTQAGLARILAQKDNPQIDVLNTTEPPAIVMRDQGASYKLPKQSIPNVKNLGPDRRYLTDYWVAFSNTINGIFYRSDKVSFEIKNWQDLFDSRLQKQVTVPFVPFASGRFLLTLALISGGSEKNIEPAFEAGKKLKPNIAMFFKNDAESIKYLQSGEAAVCAYGLMPNVYNLIGRDSKYKFVIPPQYIMVNPNVLVITNPKKQEIATKFINFCLSFEPQFQYNNMMGQLPAVTNAKLPEKLVDLKIIPIDNKNIYIPDDNIVSKNLKDWNERWEKEVVFK
jgi:putative spermidine/putrescine transport system substrate-binding protein